MSLNTPLLGLNFIAEGAIAERRIVKFGSSDAQVSPASGVADLSVGVTTDVGAVDGEPCDVYLIGIVPVVYGAAVTRGERLTSDASGRAIPVSAGTDIIIGTAMVSGVADDIGSVKL